MHRFVASSPLFCVSDGMFCGGPHGMTDFNPETADWDDVKISGIAMGHSGAMKSTFIDWAAGGSQMTAVSYGAISKTEESVCYYFNYLDNEAPHVQNKKWVMIDTPGSADTGDQDVANAHQMAQLINQVGHIDVVFLAWDYRTVRASPEVLKSAAMIRSTFGPEVWSRVVVIYTFINWSKDGSSADCTDDVALALAGMDRETCLRSACLTKEEMSQYHQTTMEQVFGFIQGDFGAPDRKCGEQGGTPGPCMPAPSDIPFFGVGSHITDTTGKVRLFRLSPHLGICPQNDIQQFTLELPSILHNMTHRGLKRLDTTHLVSGHAECLQALSVARSLDSKTDAQIDLWVTEGQYANPTALGQTLVNCYNTRIQSYAAKIRPFLEAKPAIVPPIAFSIFHSSGGTQHLNGKNGFKSLDLNLLTTWPSYRIYELCQPGSVGDTATQHHPLTRSDCRSELSNFYLHQEGADPKGNNPHQRSLLTALNSAIVCNCADEGTTSNNKFHCVEAEGTGVSQWFHCSRGQYCSGSKSYKGAGIPQDTSQVAVAQQYLCHDAPYCDGNACYSYNYLKSDQIICDGAQCDDSRCCQPRADCSQYAACGGGTQSVGSSSLCSTDASSCTPHECCHCTDWKQGWFTDRYHASCSENYDTPPCVGAQWAKRYHDGYQWFCGDPTYFYYASDSAEYSDGYCTDGECNVRRRRSAAVILAADPGADSCSFFECNATHYLKPGAEALFCSGSPCGETDQATCCQPKPKCPDVSSCKAWEYLDTDVLCDDEHCQSTRCCKTNWMWGAALTGVLMSAMFIGLVKKYFDVKHEDEHNMCFHEVVERNGIAKQALLA